MKKQVYLLSILVFLNTLLYSKTNKEEQDSFYAVYSLGYPFLYILDKELKTETHGEKKYFKNGYSDLSFYFPSTQNILLGFGLGGMTSLDEESFNYASFNFTSLYFFKRTFEGLFIKAELSPLAIITVIDSTAQETDKGGISIKAGIGHSIPNETFIGGASIGLDILFFTSIYEKGSQWSFLTMYFYFNLWI